jgi:serine phosphatase RsbU (regulator of sigma subunit)
MTRASAAVLLLLVALSAGAGEPFITLDAHSIRNGHAIPFSRGWEPFDPLLDPDRVPPAWNGAARFSIGLEVPPEVVGEALAFSINPPGIAEISLDGRRIATRGGLARGWDANALIPVRFDRAGRHRLDIDYRNPLDDELLRAGRPAGFSMWVARADAAQLATLRASRSASFMVWFFTTVFLAFGLLHFCIWLFQRHAGDNNLSFAGLCLANASLVFFLFYKELTTNQRFMLLSEPVMNVSGVLFGLFAVRFVYGVFPWRFAKPVFRVLVAIAAAIAVWSVIHTWRALPSVFGFMLLSCVEVVRVVLVALWQRRSGAHLIGLGVLVLGLGFGIALLRNLGLISGVWTPGGNLIPFASMVVLILTMSLYLSREVARLQQEETERKLLEAEYRRKTEELEEARALQMSMLPREIPRLERLEIAAWITTASEVGGDYYDFAIDGATLLLGIGDATGHGMRAGTMVTATKALFGTLGNDELAHEMAESNRALRRMNFRRLAMAFTLARFDASRMRLSSAGMPPVYVRRVDGNVESLELPGSPLGSLARFPYRQIDVPLASGDFILFMSDGLPELLSETGEMVGYERIASLLRASAAASAQELVEELVAFTNRWKGARPQDDDITFVVVRLKDAA